MTRSAGLRLTAVAAFALALAACSDKPATDSAAAPEPAPSALELQPLTPADLTTAALAGELGCSFTTDDSPPLLVAMGDVASKTPAQGAIKVAGAVIKLTSPGGFDGMLKGAAFTGPDAEVRIAVTGEATGGGESPPSPATLTFDSPPGGMTVAGSWTCGP